jgi:hypothetical protein
VDDFPSQDISGSGYNFIAVLRQNSSIKWH